MKSSEENDRSPLKVNGQAIFLLTAMGVDFTVGNREDPAPCLPSLIEPFSIILKLGRLMHGRVPLLSHQSSPSGLLLGYSWMKEKWSHQIAGHHLRRYISIY